MSPELKGAIERARNHVMTPEEKFEQRVSFVYGQQDHDKPGKSKDEIREMLIEQQGRPPCEQCQNLLHGCAIEEVRHLIVNFAETKGWPVDFEHDDTFDDALTLAEQILRYAAAGERTAAPSDSEMRLGEKE